MSKNSVEKTWLMFCCAKHHNGIFSAGKGRLSRKSSLQFIKVLKIMTSEWILNDDEEIEEEEEKEEITDQWQSFDEEGDELGGDEFGEESLKEEEEEIEEGVADTTEEEESADLGED